MALFSGPKAGFRRFTSSSYLVMFENGSAIEILPKSKPNALQGSQKNGAKKMIKTRKRGSAQGSTLRRAQGSIQSNAQRDTQACVETRAQRRSVSPSARRSARPKSKRLKRF